MESFRDTPKPQMASSIPDQIVPAFKECMKLGWPSRACSSTLKTDHFYSVNKFLVSKIAGDLRSPMTHILNLRKKLHTMNCKIREFGEYFFLKLLFLFLILNEPTILLNSIVETTIYFI